MKNSFVYISGERKTNKKTGQSNNPIGICESANETSNYLPFPVDTLENLAPKFIGHKFSEKCLNKITYANEYDFC